MCDSASRWALVLVLGLGVTLAVLSPSSAGADGYLPFPAAAETEWQILAGYNTGTHRDEDPYAIDLTRRDGPTAGSRVIAPVDGSLWLTSDCVVLRTPGGISVLLCHLIPRDGLRSNQQVRRGEVLGTLAPDGEAGNAGVSHLHLALHTGFDEPGNRTVPFVGEWALEGIGLPPTDEANAYNGRRFVSSNAPGLAPSAPVPPSPRAIEAGSRALVDGDGGCLRVRARPGLAGEVLVCLEHNDEVLVLPGTATEDGYEWRLVRAGNRVGWVAAKYLRAPSDTSTSSTARASSPGAGTILAGRVPSDGGFGLVVFGGGTSEQLLAASGCPRATAAFWASDDRGEFVPYLPASAIGAVNAGWMTRFPTTIPPSTALLGRCV